MQRRRQDIEFDLRRLFTELWRKLPVIILCAALAAVCVGTAEYFFAEREYRSATKLYVQAKQEEGGILSTDMQMNTLLTKDYAELIKTRDVTESVIEKMQLDMTHEELLSKMTVRVLADTRLIEISVTDKDPGEARQILHLLLPGLAALCAGAVFGGYINVQSPEEFILAGALYTLLYAGLEWRFGMNDKEKRLVTGPLEKVKKRLRILCSGAVRER